MQHRFSSFWHAASHFWDLAHHLIFVKPIKNKNYLSKWGAWWVLAKALAGCCFTSLFIANVHCDATRLYANRNAPPSLYIVQSSWPLPFDLNVIGQILTYLSNICLPTSLSTALSGSSNKKTSPSSYKALAKLTLAFWPPLKVTPLSPTMVLSPSANSSKSWNPNITLNHYSILCSLSIFLPHLFVHSTFVHSIQFQSLVLKTTK